jgi:KUP system potassium uptake protein
LRVVPETVVFLTVQVSHAPRVVRTRPTLQRLAPGLYRSVVEYGFMDHLHLPDAVALLSSHEGVPQDPGKVTYIASHDTFAAGAAGEMGSWSEHLFALLARNARPVTERLELPPDQVVEIGARIDL